MAGKFTDIRFNEREMCFDASTHDEEASDHRHLTVEEIDLHIGQLQYALAEAVKVREAIIELEAQRKAFKEKLEERGLES